MIRTAFLPSAGLGKRLRPLTETIPKPLLPIQGIPMIVRAMHHCAMAGIERFIINTHRQHERFEAAFPAKNWRGKPVEIIHEPIRLETGTGLRNIFETLDINEPILVYNSDILAEFPLDELLQSHEAAKRPLATLAVATTGPHLHVVADRFGRVVDIDRTGKEQSESRFQFLGISIAEPGLVPFIDKKSPESLVWGWKRAISAESGSVRIHSYKKGRWADAGTLSLYRSLQMNGLDAPEAIRLG